MVSKSSRHRRLLLIWGVSEIALALAIMLVWHPQSGLWYWVGDLIFVALVSSGFVCLKDWYSASDADILKKMGVKEEIVTSLAETMQTNNAEFPFVAFIKNDIESSYEVHLVNPTDHFYTRLYTLSWGYEGDMDGFIETSKALREKGELRPQSSLLLETGGYEDLDFVVIWYLDLYRAGNSSPVLTWFTIPKGHWSYVEDNLPILKQKGMRIELKIDREKIIEEEIKTMEMESRHVSTEDLIA
jgi:hypothetical protein